MKIGYLSFEQPKPGTGVGNKMLAQESAWRAEGHTVRHFVLRPSAEASTDEIAYPVQRKIGPYTMSAALAFMAITRAVQAFAPDVLYLREMPWFPGLGSILRAQPSVMEINSITEREATGAHLAYHRLTSRMVHNSLAGRIFVTGEIWAHYTPNLNATSHAETGIANGADFGTPMTRVRQDRPQLLLVCNADRPWHGIDRFIALAKALPEMSFHIVGPVDRPTVPENVRMHGRLTSSELASLYPTMDAGAAGLGMFLAQACPLKTREYAAMGLPVIGSYDDPDLFGADYFLRLRDDDPDQIRSFVSRWRDAPFPYDDARRRLSHSAKEQKRLEFFNQVASA